MSSATAELKPKLACRICGKPFDPEEGQEICDDCQYRRTALWATCILLLIFMFVVLPMIVKRWSVPRPKP